MEKKGYGIIEPEILFDSWRGKVVHDHLMYGVLYWLVEQLIESGDKKISNVEIEVIPVEYVSKYPAIGIHYKNPEDDDLSEYIEEKVEQLLKNKSVFDFISASFDKQTSWQEGFENLMNYDSKNTSTE